MIQKAKLIRLNYIYDSDTNNILGINTIFNSYYEPELAYASVRVNDTSLADISKDTIDSLSRKQVVNILKSLSASSIDNIYDSDGNIISVTVEFDYKSETDTIRIVSVITDRSLNNLSNLDKESLGKQLAILMFTGQEETTTTSTTTTTTNTTTTAKAPETITATSTTAQA